MMRHVTLRLDLTEIERDSLNTYYEEVVQHLEQHEPLSIQVLEKLKVALTDVVTHSSEWQKILQQVHHSGDYFCLRLMHEDNLLLNLPWSMAVDPISGQALGTLHKLYMGKSVMDYYVDKEPDHPLAPAPLKVLVMVSAPEDEENLRQDSWKHRLSYEAEELAILEQSLAIRREIDDQSGIIPTLHNMAQIAFQNKDMEKYFAYETEAYQIVTAINDAMGIYALGQYLGFFLAQAGDKEQGLAMLYRSLKIDQSAGFPDVGDVEEAIKEIENGEKQ